eukprot:3932827-Rhodomonas_salina.2
MPVRGDLRALLLVNHELDDLRDGLPVPRLLHRAGPVVCGGGGGDKPHDEREGVAIGRSRERPVVVEALRRAVAHRPALLRAAHTPGEPHVGDQGRVGGGDEEVAGLDVAVHQLPRVQVAQPVGGLAQKPKQRLPLAERPRARLLRRALRAVQHVSDRPQLRQLHHQPHPENVAPA